MSELKCIMRITGGIIVFTNNNAEVYAAVFYGEILYILEFLT